MLLLLLLRNDLTLRRLAYAPAAAAAAAVVHSLLPVFRFMQFLISVGKTNGRRTLFLNYSRKTLLAQFALDRRRQRKGTIR